MATTGVNYYSASGGTFDTTSATYILPPLIGLSYNDMIKNGMGARHAGDRRYHVLIVVHAVFAALACLLFIPIAIFCARFFMAGPKHQRAVYGHVGLHIASIIALTIAFITGWFAVGAADWGKNPHHLIGLTLYIAIILQALLGAFVRYRNMQEIFRKRIALHTMIHHWLGRGIMLLGFAQVPLGLYLYGANLAFFVIYAVIVFIVLVSWFICDYLETRGYFTHGIATHDDIDMEQAVPGVISRTSEEDEMMNGEPTNILTPRRGGFGSRFSNMFSGSRRKFSGNGNADRLTIDDHTSQDTSRDPSTHSPAVGGLHPPPSHQTKVPPLPSLPPHLQLPLRTNFGGPIASVGELEHGKLHRDDSDRYANVSPSTNSNSIRDALRNSFGHGNNQSPPLQMPELQDHLPASPVSPFFPVTAVIPPVARYDSSDGVSPVSSPSQQQYHHGAVIPPSYAQHEEIPSSPNIGYMEADNGFLHSPNNGNPPVVPLPMLPEPRRPNRRSNEESPRSPHTQSVELLPLSPQQPQGPRPNPNVAVQVKLNPDGKSVTVRRLPPDEAEQERRERARARAERAQQREISLDRERQMGRSNSGRRSRRPSVDPDGYPEISRPGPAQAPAPAPAPVPAPHPAPQHHPNPSSFSPPLNSNPDYASSVGGQSSTISHAAGNLLGRGAAIPVQNVGQPVPGFQTARGSWISPSQRGSLVSGSGTTENSEVETENMMKHRLRRREERGGTGDGSGQVGSSSGGGGSSGFK
ncbi:hypothetical protein RUND412_002858 [Rhizina undulata]